MSKHTRALVLTAIVAAVNLAGMTAIAQAQPPDGIEQFRRGERASQEQSTTDAQERFRRGERASQEQTTSDATVRRLLARERSSIPSATPAQVPAPARPDEHTGQPDWLVLWLGVLAAALALSTGMAVLAVRRANRRVRAGQTA
jgi:hypothetical protein